VPAAGLVDEEREHVVALREPLGHGAGRAQAHLVLAGAASEHERHLEPRVHEQSLYSLPPMPGFAFTVDARDGRARAGGS
jgi:hypothetical protein